MPPSARNRGVDIRNLGAIAAAPISNDNWGDLSPQNTWAAIENNSVG